MMASFPRRHEQVARDAAPDKLRYSSNRAHTKSYLSITPQARTHLSQNVFSLKLAADSSREPRRN